MVRLLTFIFLSTTGIAQQSSTTEPVMPQLPQATITGQITDLVGAVVPKARVLIHCDGSSGCRTDDVSVYTDARGNYSALVEAGAYDLFVSSPGMTPVAVRAIIKAGKRTRFNTSLKVAPGVDVREGR